MTEPRQLIAEGLQSYLNPEQITRLIDEALAIDKRRSAEFTCTKCKARQMQWVSIPDAKAVVSAVADLLAQGYGRPVEATDKAEPIRFKRLTINDDDPAVEKALKLAVKSRKKHLAEEADKSANLSPDGR